MLYICTRAKTCKVKRCLHKQPHEEDGLNCIFANCSRVGALVKCRALKTKVVAKTATNSAMDKICPHHDLWTLIDSNKNITHRIHACLCEGKLHQ